MPWIAPCAWAIVAAIAAWCFVASAPAAVVHSASQRTAYQPFETVPSDPAPTVPGAAGELTNVEPVPPGTNPLAVEAEVTPIFTPSQPQWQGNEPEWCGPNCDDGACCRWHGLEHLHQWWHRWFPPSNGRFRPIGDPLEHESWLNRPYYISILTGALFADNPVRGEVNGTPGYMAGVRLGWDVEYFWGVEMRVATSTFGLSSPDPLFVPGKMKSYFWDTSVMYYPWGDTRWRPYLSFGLGMADYRYSELNTGAMFHQTALGMPIGLGFKYRHNSAWIFRVDVTDNLSFTSGQHFQTMNNFSLTGGLDIKFGIGPRKSYWPWNPSRSFH